MQLLTEREAEEAEVRAHLKDENYIREMHSRLVPGFEKSEERFRVHQFTRAALILPDFSEYGILAPLIDGLVRELDPRDFLGCTTALEILAEMAAARRQNVEYFKQIGLLDNVYRLFEHTKQDPDMGILHIACVRFFGYLSTADPDSLVTFPLFTADVFDAVYRFDAFDATRRQLAFDTLAVISSTSGAKQFLTRADCPYDMARALNHLGVAIATGMPELKARHLESTKIIFDSFNSPEESTPILERWFHSLGPPFPQLLFQYIKTPVPEVQIAALQVLLSLMRHQWGPKQVSPINGFVEFLVDRSANLSAEGFYLKYDLVHRLINAGSNELKAAQMELLRDYHAKGVFYPPERMEVATEEA